MNLSDTLLVVAPHQFSQENKQSPQNAFDTSTQILDYGRMSYKFSSNRSIEAANSPCKVNDTLIDDNVTEDNNHQILPDVDLIKEGHVVKKGRSKKDNISKLSVQSALASTVLEDNEGIKFNEQLSLEKESNQEIQLFSLTLKKNENELLRRDENQQSVAEMTQAFGCVTLDNQMRKNGKNEISSTTQKEDKESDSIEIQTVQQSKQIKPTFSEPKEKDDIPSIVPLPKEKSLTEDTLKAVSKKNISTHKKKNIGPTFNPSTVATWLVWCIVLLSVLYVLSNVMYGKNFATSEKRCSSTGIQMHWEKGPPPT